MPLALVCLLSYVGPISAAGTALLVSLVFGTVAELFGAGWLGFFGSVLFLVPYLLVASLLAEKKRGFWQSVGISAAVLFVGACSVTGLIGMVSGMDVVSALTHLIRESILDREA